MATTIAQHRVEPTGPSAPLPTGHIPWTQHEELRTRGILWGLAAALAMLGVYFGVLWAANSLEHALGELRALWGWMVPIVVGFGVQVGLFVYARGATRGHMAHAHGIMASGGISTVSMVACCAHHVTDVLPFVGLATASVFLAQYRPIFLAAGLASNAVGLAYMLRLLQQHRLSPDPPSLLTHVLRFPFARAFPWLVALAVLGFSVVLVTELTELWG